MTDDLPQRLAEGVSALRDGQASEAVELLAPVATSPDLAAAEDLRDIRARVCTLYAQALLQSGQASKARRPLADARDLLTTLGDAQGLAAVEELQAQVAEAITEAFQASARRRTLLALAERPLADILAEAPSDRHLDLTIERATAALEAKRSDEAVTLAQTALEQADRAGDIRHQVLALLVLARAGSDVDAVSHLEDARRRADEADEFNLLGFVVKAAEQAGVRLHTRGIHQ